MCSSQRLGLLKINKEGSGQRERQTTRENDVEGIWGAKLRGPEKVYHGVTPPPVLLLICHPSSAPTVSYLQPPTHLTFLAPLLFSGFIFVVVKWGREAHLK